MVWFKTTDLRLHDHAPLRAAHAAARQDGSCVIHLCVLDTTWYSAGARSRLAGLGRVGALRGQFLLESVRDLERSLSRGLGGEGGPKYRLLTFHGHSRDAIAELSRAYNIITIHAHGPEFCSEEREVEAAVRAAVETAGGSLDLHWGWTLHHIDDLPQWMRRGKKTPGRYKPFLQAVQRGRGSKFARRCLPDMSADEVCLSEPVPNLATFTASARGHWRLPELGQVVSERALAVAPRHRAPERGGETAAIEAMRNYIWERDRLRVYVGSSDSMSPGKNNALNSTTKLSAYIAHGCLSPRRLYDEVRRYEKTRVRNRSTYWVFHELVFRDFFVFSSIRWGNALFSRAGPLGATRHAWCKDPARVRRLFDRWRQGRTGYPFIDAAMRQLRAEGRMPHLLRQAVAGFLVRDLRVDWRFGAEWFEQCLVDYTPDANWGNWGYRIVPINQLQPLETAHITSLEVLSWPCVQDPHLEYILRWVPELRPLAAGAGADGKRLPNSSKNIVVREPWRLAEGYRRVRRVHVKPGRDSPLWIMSVNRVNWPAYEKMMTGFAHTVEFQPESDVCVHAKRLPNYPPPIVPPLELEIIYDKIPLDHSWGKGPAAQGSTKPDSARRAQPKADRKGNGANGPATAKRARKRRRRRRRGRGEAKQRDIKADN